MLLLDISPTIDIEAVKDHLVSCDVDSHNSRDIGGLTGVLLVEGRACIISYVVAR